MPLQMDDPRDNVDGQSDPYMVLCFTGATKVSVLHTIRIKAYNQGNCKKN